MLETKDLVKIYRPKKGVPVTALDGVTLKFPERGMVFLLGKSGSGKSTLLNVLGGLDSYDNGEIFIKGVSSKKFNQSHFDSYRNTYVGFIFQEYNILEEFSVGANIALAIELQGRKATDAELNNILDEVDLAGYGARRPNELSGGQKQRVAIARALVKNPKIIMADEPSGALDSATGKQVFDTLKKLSKEKLVIVVSHDRDFANEYADRIIELADGKVISDTTVYEEPEENIHESISFEGNVAKVPMGYHLTEEDRIAINEYIDKLQSGAEIEFSQKCVNRNFVPTDNEKIINEDKTPFKLIKSKLSLKRAFKIGSGGLKYKKFRLVMTILLSCIAFILFGLVDTFSSYDHITSTTNSIYDSGIKYAAVNKQIKVGDDDDFYWDGYGNKMSEEEIASLSQETEIDFKGVLTNNRNGFYFDSNLGKSGEDYFYNYYDMYVRYFSGMVEVNQSDIDKKGYELIAGRMPDGNKNEILISDYLCESFIKYGYRHINDEGVIGDTKSIASAKDMVGKKLMLDAIDFEIVGVVDTKLDIDRYAPLFEEQNDDSDAAGMILDFVLYAEFESAVRNDYTGMAMVGEGFIERYRNMTLDVSYAVGKELCFTSDDGDFYPYNLARLDRLDKSEVIWLDGERASLGEKEILVTMYTMEYMFGCVDYDNDTGEYQLDTEKASKIVLDLACYDYTSDSTSSKQESGYKIVGVIDTYSGIKYENLFDVVILSDSLYEYAVGDTDGIYDLALGTMPMAKGDINRLAKYCYTEKGDVMYALNNPASFELDALNEIIDVLADIFLYVGIGFLVFASILLSNFIATSISYKKQEIGILRAIGSRGNDVFRIFFAEAFIIAMINFVLACIGTGFVTYCINTILRENAGLLITVLHFGIRQILVIFLVSLAAAAIASFLPVKRIASKKPIDAIRDR